MFFCQLAIVFLRNHSFLQYLQCLVSPEHPVCPLYPVSSTFLCFCVSMSLCFFCQLAIRENGAG